MDYIFLASKFLVQLIMPPASLLIVAILALFMFKRWPRSARAALWLSLGSLLLLSLPIVAGALNDAQSVASLDRKAASQAQAIIILGGGIYRNTHEYGDTPSSYSLERIRYGAKLAREYHLPVLITGGQVYGGRPEAEVMAETMTREFGVPVRWIENRARDTAENARFSAVMLQKDHIDKAILVTHDNHMRRALTHCAATGLQCAAAPITSGGAHDSFIEQLPSAGALQKSALALHEMLGNLAVRWR